MVVSLEAEQRALDARKLLVLAEWDRRGAWADDGSLGAAPRLAREGKLDRRTARERVSVASKLASMPHVAAALEELGWPKARLLARACNERTAPAFAEAEAGLVAKALELSVDQLAFLLLHWRRIVDADGALRDADSVHAEQFVQLSTSWEGEGFLTGRLDAESTAIVQGALDEIMDEMHRSRRREVAEAMLRGNEPEPQRAHSSRVAEAFVEMARRSREVTRASRDPEGSDVIVPRRGPAKPLLLVHVDVDDTSDVLARLASGAPLDASASARWACDAAIAAVVSEGRTVPLDLGRTVRSPSEAQRRALSALWGTCGYPSCDRPFAWCELHHVVHWEAGGRTDIASLLPLCSPHHHLHHSGRFTIERCRDGTFEFARADGTPIGPANPTITRLVAAARSLARPAAAASAA
jgi:hypothetical protein